MIQFFKYEKSDADNTEYKIISGKESVKFFIKRVIYLVLFFYSTLFLAVAIPFVTPPYTQYLQLAVYFLGSMATSLYIVRFSNHIIKYRKFKNGSITFNKDGIRVITSDSTENIPFNEITYIEHNVIGDLVIKDKYTSTAFPFMLISEDDRERIESNLKDMAPKRTAVYRKIWEIVDAIVVALILAVHIIQFAVQAFNIPTGSMRDTLIEGDHLFVEKVTYGPIIPKMLGMDERVKLKWPLISRDVKRKDIIIFRPPHDADKEYIKRCIALPGEKFEVKDGFVFINDKKIDEPYLKCKTYYFGSEFKQEWNDQGKEPKLIQIVNGGIVPEGYVVAMGDNRGNSADSRTFGYLEIKRIEGRAFILYWNSGDFIDKSWAEKFSRLGLIR